MLSKINLFLLLFIILTLFGCSSEDVPSSFTSIGNYNPDGDDKNNTPPVSDDPNEVKYRWDVPGGATEIVLGCLGGFSCIPSLQDPSLISLEEANYFKRG